MSTVSLIIKTLIILLTCLGINGYKYPCSDRSVMQIFRKSSYEFSVKILDRVHLDKHEGHFVFSPLSTWIQLMMLAERSQRSTSQEIWKAAKFHLHQCFRRRLKRLLINIATDVKSFPGSGLSGIIAFDKKYDVNFWYKRRIRQTQLNSRGLNYRIIPLPYDDPATATEINNIIASDINEDSADVFDADDFVDASLIVTDVAKFKPTFSVPFDKLNTKLEAFSSESGNTIGRVHMMEVIANFNFTELPIINAKVLELPCDRFNKISMLIFLPIKGSIEEIFFKLRRLRLMTIFNRFSFAGSKRVHVKLPRFKLSTDFDNLAEVLGDIGINRIFDRNLAEFRGLSDHSMFVSLMSQLSVIEVTEGDGIPPINSTNDEILRFTANRPFAFMVVHRKLRIILQSGLYSKPSLDL